MRYAVNSLLSWKLDNNLKVERVIWIGDSEIVVICMDSNDAPYFRNTSEVAEAFENNLIEVNTHDPYIRLIKEDDISDKHKQIRDKLWDVIKDIVIKEPEIFQAKLRRKMIKDVSDKSGISQSSIFRYIKKYWKRGKSPNALLPDYIYCGGKGKERIAGSSKRGRPRKYSNITGNGINVTENIKKIFRTAINRFYYTTAKNSLVLTYELMRKEYFAEGFKVENGVKIPIIKAQGTIPSFGQFRYWYEKNLDLKRSITSRYSNKKFQKQFRAITGSKMDGVMQPGTYEIDCQVADVYLVSRFNRNHVIGRPALYVCIDKFSSCVAGIYVGLESGSFMGAAMALANAASDKVAFCKEYGIDIQESMWPISYLPECIIADRGELEGKGIENFINSLGIRIQNTPPYRADFKSNVERFFGLTNDRVKPFIPGVVDLDGRERGDKDYRLKAKLDLYQFIQIITKCVLYHNNSYYLNNYNREEAMIEDDVPCIPIKLWEWGIQNRGGSLRSVPEETVKLALMPTETVTVTPKGIKLMDMYYVSKGMLKDQTFVKARVKGTWKMKASYDPRNLNFIYLHGDRPNEYEKCILVESQGRYKDKTIEEIMFLLQIEKMQKERIKDSVAQAKTQLITEIEDVVEQAENDLKKEIETVESNRERVKNIRANRYIEKAVNRVEEAFEVSLEGEVHSKDIESGEASSEYDNFEFLLQKQKEGLE